MRVAGLFSPWYNGTIHTSPSERGEGRTLKHSLGAIVDEGQLCLVCLRLGVGRAEVAGVFRAQLPPGADEEPAFLEELSAFLIASRVPAGVPVTLGVPRGEFIQRRFQTPPVKARNLPALVGFEVERHLPGRREDFLCGWRVDGRSPGGGYFVLLGAARKACIERPATLLRRANLPPASIQPVTFAIAGLLRRASGLKGDALFIDLGHACVGLDFIHEGRPELSWNVPIDDPQWRSLPTNLPGADAPEVDGAALLRQEAAQRLGSALAERLASPLFLESFPGRSLPEVLIGGHGANRSHLIQKLQSLQKDPLRTFSPWPLVHWGKPPADLAPFTASLALAFAGDSSRDSGLELDPERQEALHRAPSLRLSAVLALALVAVLAAYGVAYGLRQQRQLALADSEIRLLKTKKEKIDKISRVVQEQRVRLNYLSDSVRGRVRPTEILRELTGLLPDTAYLSELNFRERTVEITGLAPSASQLLSVLEASPLFSGVEFSAPIVAQGAGLERFRIRMKVDSAGG
jgi:Tfp pilus assembly protein PilN